MQEQLDAKERIIKAAMDILEEETDAEKITVRRIAEKAQVGTGLINYHFQSKEKLLNEAIAVRMAGMAELWMKTASDKGMAPMEKLKKMLKALVDFGMRYPKFIKIAATYQLLQGDMDTPLYLIPVMREIYGNNKDEREIRIVALALVSTLQTAFLRSRYLKGYIGCDINNETDRDRIIDILVDHFVRSEGSE